MSETPHNSLTPIFDIEALRVERDEWKERTLRAEAEKAEMRETFAQMQNVWDTSVGDVVHAQADGSITLDDGITTYHPLRACAFLVDRAEKAEAEVARLRKIKAAAQKVSDAWRGTDSWLSSIGSEICTLREALAEGES